MIFSVHLLFGVAANAQQETGRDTVFACHTYATEIVFHDRPVEIEMEKGAPYSFLVASKSVIVSAKAANARPARMLVTEGPRTHAFILVYRSQMPVKNYRPDYSDLKKSRGPKAIAAKTEEQLASDEQEPRQEEKNHELSYYGFLDAGDRALREGRFEEAGQSFDSALRLRPGETYAQTRREEAGRKLAEKQRQAQEAARNAGRYTALLAEADQLFADKKYEDALARYRQAGELNKESSYPQVQISRIGGLLQLAAQEKARSEAEAAESERRFRSAFQKGNAALAAGDLAAARISFAEALALKPSDATAQKLLAQVSRKQSEQQRQQEQSLQYEAALTLAYNALTEKAYGVALAGYREALRLRPGEAYPQKQIDFIEALLKEKEKQKGERLFQNAVDRAEKAGAEGRLEEALAAYKEALALHPFDSLVLVQIERIRTEMARLSNREPIFRTAQVEEGQPIPGLAGLSEPPKERKKKDRKKKREPQTDPAVIPPKTDSGIAIIQPSLSGEPGLFRQALYITYSYRAAIPESRFADQQDLLPYTPAELKQKYPRINFRQRPSGQLMYGSGNSGAKDSVCREVLLEKRRLFLFDTLQEVRLLLEGISFRGKEAFLRLLVQNGSTTDFLTGAQVLRWHQPSGKTVYLFPTHVYPGFPVIKPGQQMRLVYVTKAWDISLSGELHFEMKDRQRHRSLSIPFPAEVYIGERSR